MHWKVQKSLREKNKLFSGNTKFRSHASSPSNKPKEGENILQGGCGKPSLKANCHLLPSQDFRRWRKLIRRVAKKLQLAVEVMEEI